ncbi:putative methyltransferase-domain-containing protein [Daedaleopsis nitida]|nr:putative methyltransferase-domain-containing protein [Daedaleopsis nitida]
MADLEVNHENMTVRGVIRLPPESTPMTDADEEVFLLYTSLAARKVADGDTTAFRGLGHIDSHQDTLTICLNIGTRTSADTPEPVPRKQGHHAKRKRRARDPVDHSMETLEVDIVQDKTALRSRKGDTGSVVWHASVDFAEAILQQLHRRNAIGFFIPSQLINAHVVELGAGTGLLSIVLSPFVRHYTVTDIDDLVPLIRKNVTRNLSPDKVHSSAPRMKHGHPPPQFRSNITVTGLDWVEIHNAPPSLRARLVPDNPADVLLVVDCIYHPSLLPALLATIDYLTIPSRTTVVVVVELRAEDVIREFLQGWLDKSVDGEWEIWSVNRLLDGPYAVWVGWKNSKKPLES